MICGIYVFTSAYKLIAKRIFHETQPTEKLGEEIKSHIHSNFVDTKDTVVHKKFNGFTVCIVVRNENEMFALSIVTLLATALQQFLGEVNGEQIEKHFQDVYRVIDNFILDGKVMCTDLASISNLTPSCDVLND